VRSLRGREPGPPASVLAESDLQVGGEFELLGREAGMGRSLTLDEGLTAGQSPS